MSKDEAFGTLLAACDDGTLLGLRDEMVLRFGLLGLRRQEVRNLTVGHVVPAASAASLAVRPQAPP